MIDVKTFDAEQQKVQDILRAIDTIEPVIDILRRMYKIKDIQIEIHEEGIEKNGMIEAYKQTINDSSSKTLIAKLNGRIERLEEEVQDGILRYNSLEEEWDNLSEELGEYVKYILSFEELTLELAEEVFAKLLEEDNNRKFIAATLLFTNENVEDAEIFEFLYEAAIDEELEKAIEEAYDDPNAFFVFIGLTDLLNE